VTSALLRIVDVIKRTIAGGLLLVVLTACHRESELAYEVMVTCSDLSYSLRREAEEYRAYLARSALILSDPQRERLDQLFESGGLGSRSQGGRTSTSFALSSRFHFCIRARRVADEKRGALLSRIETRITPFSESNNRAVQLRNIEELADLAAEVDALPLKD
jgi:hypothetical protein